MNKLKTKNFGRKICLVGCAIFSSHIISAQVFTERSSGTYGGTFNFKLSEYDDDDKKVKGSPYLVDDWTKAMVYRSSGDSIFLEEVKFNVFAQKLVFSFKDKDYYFPPNDVKSFKLNSDEFVKVGLSKIDTAFCKVIFSEDGKSILEATEIFLREGKESTGYVAAKPASYERRDELILKVNSDVYRVQIKKKKIKLIPENSDLEDQLSEFHQKDTFDKIENFVSALRSIE